jgi:hypothetical protein
MHGIYRKGNTSTHVKLGTSGTMVWQRTTTFITLFPQKTAVDKQEQLALVNAKTQLPFGLSHHSA